MSPFLEASTAAASNDRLKRAINNAVLRQYIGRQEKLAELADPKALRRLAGQIKQHTIEHLDYYLQQMIQNVERAGGHVHFAADAEEAKRIIADLATAAGCKRCVKTKSMVTEEIELTPALEAAGIEVVETDLGEFIVQIGHDRPSHIVAPIIHKDKASIATLFADYFHTPYNDDAQSLTKQARVHLREKFRRADLGITGANFMIAETGQLAIVTNEGNGRMVTAMPRVLISVVGIEKLIPRMLDLSVFAKLLARSATGQTMGVYTSIFGGPRKPGEKDGPEDFHLVLLDAGRSEILAGEYRELLRCIRCGACLNACPVYRKIGGHAYGAVYCGPIGALVTPLFKGLDDYQDLPKATTLCGACAEACPVMIDLPHHLIQMRRDMVSRRMDGFFERLIYRTWARFIGVPFFYRWMCRVQKWVLRKRAVDGWISKLPAPASGWTAVRDMPEPAKKTFQQLWRKRPKGGMQ